MMAGDGIERSSFPSKFQNIVHSPKLQWGALCIIIIGALLRVSFLEADPYYYEWAGYITDEGRWIEHARSYFLFKEIPGNLLHLIVAPFFQAIHYCIFLFFGFNMVTCRVFTALAGIGVLILFWRSFYRQTTRQAMVLGLALLATQADLVMLSRVTIPEMACIFIELLIYVLIVSRENSSARMVLIGFMMFIMTLTKLTTAPMVVIYLAMILLMPQAPAEKNIWRKKLRQTLATLSGFLIPFSIAALMVFLSGRLTLSPTVPAGETIINFIKLSTLYSAISFFFEHPFSQTLNFWALGLWVNLLLYPALKKGEMDIQSKRYLVSSWVWIILYLIVMKALGYFPTRYQVGILVPICINIIIGLSYFQKVGLSGISDSFTKSTGPSHQIKLWLLYFPTAVFFSPLYAGILEVFTKDSDHLYIKVSSVAASTFLMGLFVNRKKAHHDLMPFFLVFPIVGAISWMALNAAGVNLLGFWPETGTRSHFFIWLIFLSCASAITGLLIKFKPFRDHITVGRAICIAASLILVISIIKILPQYTHPHYTIRNTSNELAKFCLDWDDVVCVRAEGLFNNNKIPYRTKGTAKKKGSDASRIFVVAFANNPGQEEIFEKHFELIKSYDIYVSSEYYRLNPESVQLFPKGSILRIFKME